MQNIDFYKLSRVVQERFVGSVNGSGLPAPILRSNAPPREPAMWLGASVGSVILLLVLYKAGYGDLASGTSIEGAKWLVAYVALFALAVFGVLHAAAIYREHKKSPFRRGVYVFPVGLIDARGATLRLYPIEDLANVVGPGGPSATTFTLDFGGKSFAFTVKDGAQAEHAKSELASARGKMGDAGAARESIRPKALAALDPLQGYANPLVSSEPMTPSAPPWATFGWAFAAISGVVLGISLWAVRNARSDDALYDQALAANDGASFRAYLDKASRHKTEVSSLLLPRAELRDAQKVGTVDAIEQFIKDHPQTSIANEVAAALKSALLAELATATQVGTLSAIDDFTKKHPQNHLDAEVRAARHAVYQAALDRYMAQAPASTKSAAEQAFVKGLLDWAEMKGPPVEIRFHRTDSKSMDKADAAAAKSRMFKGVVSTPSRYFDASDEKPYEDALATAIVKRFSDVFPTEIVALAVGEPIADPDAPLPAQVAVPTLFIEHGASWSGSITTSRSPSGVFVGLEITFNALFRVPDDTKPVKVKTDAWHSPNLAAAKDADKPEDTVYAAMHQEAYDQFQKHLLNAFFKSGSGK
jgi:hypothetical protein